MRLREYEDSERPETAAQAYERRRTWRFWDLQRALWGIRRARAVNCGRTHVGSVPVYPEDTSEKNIQEAIKRLNQASWLHHTQ